MDRPWLARRSTPPMVMGLLLIGFLAVAFGAYDGRTREVAKESVVLGYPDDGNTYPGAAYRTGISAIDTAGDVTASPGLGALGRIAVQKMSQVSASVLSPITTGSYTLRCVRLRFASAGVLVGTDFTDATCLVPSSPQYQESSGYLTNRVTFDTDGATQVLILVAAINHPTLSTMDTCSIFAEAN